MAQKISYLSYAISYYCLNLLYLNIMNNIPRHTNLLAILCTLVFFVLTGCSSDQQPDAQKLVDQTIKLYGGEAYNQSNISFQFRDRQYRALRDNGAYVYSRTFTDSTGQRIYDVLQNSGFTRTINGAQTTLPKEEVKAYSASVNSVIYFALLPYFLNDGAVQKAYAGEATIKGEPYHKIRVTFAAEGGGDHQDTYLYWLHQQHHTMDYLAYSFLEKDGSEGIRFRVATNPREVSGIRFQDYENYTSEAGIALEMYDSAYEAGQLKKVSDINLEEVVVKPVK